MKECNKCGKIKEYSSFNNSSVTKDGLFPSCKECYNNYRKMIRIKHIKETFIQPSEEFLISNYKKCCICKNDKLLIDFSKDKSNANGRSNKCILCKNSMSREFKKKNKEKIRKKSQEYYKKNKEKISEYNKNRYIKKAEHIKKIAKIWRQNNKEKVRENRRNYERNNKEKMKEKRKRYVSNNRDKISLKNSRRKALKRKSVHPDLNNNIYTVYYNMKNRLEQCLGIKYNIDHILPIARGGYHHHLNLQVIPADLNFVKNDNLKFKHPILIHWTELPDFLLDRMKPEHRNLQHQL